MGRAVWSLVILGALVAPAPGRARPPTLPSATVLAVEGRATIRASPTGREGGSRLLLEVLDPLTTGEQVDLDADAVLWVLDAEGRPLALRGPGTWRITVEGLRAADRPRRGGEPDASMEGLDVRVPEAAVEAAWRPEADESGRSDFGDVRVLTPAETSVRGRRPVLEWRPRWNVSRWDLGLWRLGEEGSLAPVERWTELAQTAHVPWGELEPGAFYRWEVSPSRLSSGDGGRAASAWFHVLTPDQERALDADLARVSALREAHPDARRALEVVRALLLERYGLLAEAEAGWRSMLRAAPDSRPILRRLERLARRRLVEPRERVAMSRSVLPEPPMCREEAP